VVILKSLDIREEKQITERPINEGKSYEELPKISTLENDVCQFCSPLGKPRKTPPSPVDEWVQAETIWDDVSVR
jgi:hypothetical protein